MGLKYVMVTHWGNHWNNLPNNETYFTKNMLKKGMTTDEIRENTPTIFIKLKSKYDKKPERAWEGKVYGFKYDGTRIRFKVKIDREIPIPAEYSNYLEGWYVEGLEDETLSKGALYPPFFYILNATNDWKEFERYTHLLFKLLGVSQIIKYEKQRGEPDGFFKIGNLAVIYDATLESNFQKTKETQIRNYVNQLKANSIKYKDRRFDVSNCNKQVWIITRGSSRILEKTDNIIIKEVPINKLIEVYTDRLKKSIDETELKSTLENL